LKFGGKSRVILRSTGSIYLHCDSSASHYIKVMMDGIFGHQNFRNEIIWKRTNVHNDSKDWSTVSDTILYYVKDARKEFTWNPIYMAYSPEHIESKYKADENGRFYTLSDMTSPSPRPNMMYEWKGFISPAMGWRYSKETMASLDAEGKIWYPEDKSKRPRLRRYLDEGKGTLATNIWTDISPINSQAKERLGYPTQKPIALLERIIKASSKEGDVIFDPFCGCGTTIYSAEKNNRTWIGCDIAILAIKLIREVLAEKY